MTSPSLPSPQRPSRAFKLDVPGLFLLRTLAASALLRLLAFSCLISFVACAPICFFNFVSAEGRVVDSNDRPVANAAVYIGEGKRYRRCGLTSQEGWFNVSTNVVPPQPGSTTACACAPGFRESCAPLRENEYGGTTRNAVTLHLSTSGTGTPCPGTPPDHCWPYRPPKAQQPAVPSADPPPTGRGDGVSRMQAPQIHSSRVDDLAFPIAGRVR